MNKLVIFASSLSQPRILKRIRALMNHGFSLKVYGYDRGLYTCNTLPPGIFVKKLGTLKNGQGYLKRFFRVFLDIITTARRENSENVLFYSFGIIEGLILRMLRKPYIYEISDLSYGKPKLRWLLPIFKRIDIDLVRNSKLTIMTSEGFVRFLFGRTPPSNVLIQPNKLNSYFLNITRQFRKIDKMQGLIFSFVGAIRHPDTILRFAKIIGMHYPDHRFVFWGEGDDSDFFKEQTKKFENVIFYGAYRNPEDLEKIYSESDIVVSCYGHEGLNNQLAEPNKLYEAIFFNKPIVVSSKTFVADQVKRFQCGFAINASSDIEIRHFIDSISNNVLSEIQQREMSVHTENLIDSSTQIIKRIEAIFAN